MLKQLIHLCATLQVPQPAQWLQQYYSAPSEAPLPAALEEELGQADEAQSGSGPRSKQEHFKQSVQASKEFDKPAKPAAVLPLLAHLNLLEIPLIPAIPLIARWYISTMSLFASFRP